MTASGAVTLMRLALFGLIPGQLVAQKTVGSAPPRVLAGASVAIRTLLGDSLFATATTPKPEWTEFQPTATSDCDATCLWPWRAPYYVVFFTFHPTKDERRNGLIVVAVDTIGRAIPDYPPFGAPACATTIALCDFRVSADSAVAIAKTSGFPAGNKAWDISFSWTAPAAVGDCPPCAGHFDYGAPIQPPRYAWRILTRLTGEAGGAGTGETLWIDANSGVILHRTSWQAEE